MLCKGGGPQTNPPPEGKIFLRDPKLCRPPCGGRVVEVDDVVHEEELSHSPPGRDPAHLPGGGPVIL